MQVSNLFKAFDVKLDRLSRDSGFDLRANKTLSKDAQLALRTQFSDRQRLTVATNYFALACPIMPLGLLGAFMMLDRLDRPEDKHQLLQDRLRSRQHELTQAQALYLAAMKQKQEVDQKKAGLACSRPIEGLTPLTDKQATKKTKDAEVLFEGKRSERLNGPVLLSKGQSPQSDLGKLIKSKMALQSHLEEANKEQDFAAVCRVSSRIELLEKALKKMGC